MAMIQAACRFCEGTGRIDAATNAPGGKDACYACKGAGTVTVEAAGKGAAPCPFCDGGGRMEPDVPKPRGNYPCPACDGCGYAGRPDLDVTESV